MPTWPRTSKVSSSARTLHLFRRDLRLTDHAGLAEAARHGEVVPALVLDPLDGAHLARSARRVAFHAGAIASLERDLRLRGSHLVVRRGSLETAILALAREAEATTITWCAGYDARSIARDSALRTILEAAGLTVAIVHDAPAVAPEVTAALRADGDGRGYRAFAAYEAVWAQAGRAPVAERIAFAAHGLASDESRQTHASQDCGDESPDPTRALAAFDRYLAGPVLGYPSAHAIPAGEVTARVSAALSFGVLSARTLLARIDARARDPFLLTEEKLALAAFSRAIVRRDFFLQLAWYFDDVGDVALQSRMRDFPFALDHPVFATWCDGTTGYPLVDAGIRQLHATGWMHPRVRAVAASFCAFDLGIDWRVGRDVWDEHLVEDDGALATGNWQWIAGVGADLAQFPRIYNPRKGLREVDSLGTYVRRWIPELAHVTDADLLETQTLRVSPQLRFQLNVDASYPAPVVDHDRAAREFLARYASYTSAQDHARKVGADSSPEYRRTEVRRAGANDAGSVRELTRTAYARWVAVIGREPRPMIADDDAAVRDHLVDLLLADGKLVGLIEMRSEDGHLSIVNVAVAPLFQGNGFGSLLLAHAEEVARSLGHRETRLYVNGKFVDSLRLYGRVGYRVDREEIDPRFGTIVHMSKHLPLR